MYIKFFNHVILTKYITLEFKDDEFGSWNINPYFETIWKCSISRHLIKPCCTSATHSKYLLNGRRYAALAEQKRLPVAPLWYECKNGNKISYIHCVWTLHRAVVQRVRRSISYLKEGLTLIKMNLNKNT